MLPGRWSTDRLLMRDVATEYAPRLLAIFNANAHIGAWDATFQPIAQLEMDGLVAASCGNCPRTRLPGPGCG